MTDEEHDAIIEANRQQMLAIAIKAEKEGRVSPPFYSHKWQRQFIRTGKLTGE